MQEIQSYLDSTYLNKTEKTDFEFIKNFVLEAIEHDFKLVMIRPEIVSFARNIIDSCSATTLVGTVIDFPFGNASLDDKLKEAKKAIADGANELDFVANYNLFKQGEIDFIEQEVLSCTKYCLFENKTIKWIIESAALSDKEIISICNLIKNIVVSNFSKDDFNKVFLKSSTGFYATENNLSNGATKHVIKIMVENSFPLPVKASGGVRSAKDAIEMLNLGVNRIGTSSALKIINEV